MTSATKMLFVVGRVEVYLVLFQLVNMQTVAAFTPAPTGPPPPTNLQFTTVGTDILEVSWTASSSAATYRVTYEPVGGAETVSVASTTDNPYTITGLTAGTLYTVRVYGISNGVESGPLQGDQGTSECNYCHDIARPSLTSVLFVLESVYRFSLHKAIGF
ncbi:fibronectin-like [Branchiostoma floridae]|uniref:Fibronectin-like n=1 Tax=Branchiostoma floridae TaxID=7739 RepID=A0A9J7M2Z4_BRAFL|nr:fibronectin-like [Branchiostoma floridae]